MWCGAVWWAGCGAVTAAVWCGAVWCVGCGVVHCCVVRCGVVRCCVVRGVLLCYGLCAPGPGRPSCAHRSPGLGPGRHGGQAGPVWPGRLGRAGLQTAGFSSSMHSLFNCGDPCDNISRQGCLPTLHCLWHLPGSSPRQNVFFSSSRKPKMSKFHYHSWISWTEENHVAKSLEGNNPTRRCRKLCVGRLVYGNPPGKYCHKTRQD